jgi:hypothetical protein
MRRGKGKGKRENSGSFFERRGREGFAKDAKKKNTKRKPKNLRKKLITIDFV